MYLAVDIPKEVHTQAKLHAIMDGVTLKEYIIRLIIKDAKKENE